MLCLDLVRIFKRIKKGLKVFKFDAYYYKEKGEAKVLFSLNWYTCEDHWIQRFIFNKPLWSEDDMKRIGEQNANRYKWFTMSINIMHYIINLNIRLKKVGNVYYGRVLHDEPKESPFTNKDVVESLCNESDVQE